MVETSSAASNLRPVVAVLGLALLLLAACSSGGEAPACSEDTLKVGFYAFFAPISYSADDNPAADRFNTHLGYEADLLSTLEIMEGEGMSFSRRGIAAWDNIWLLSAGQEYDLIGGGITILDSRTKDADGNQVVQFTSGHVGFRQSLLVRAADAERLSSHEKLTDGVRVGVLAGTTGEGRLLELTGLVDSDGVLTAGTAVETPEGAVVADGSTDYVITSAMETGNLEGRTYIRPASTGMPQVVYLGQELGEKELFEALASGAIDAVARGEIGNRTADNDSKGKFVVTALDDLVELGGFTLAAGDTELASCINERIKWLTDNRNIGYAEWLEDPSIFTARARMWNGKP